MEDKLENMVLEGVAQNEIAKYFKKSKRAIRDKISRMSIDNPISKNNPSYKAVYQDYDWCYEHYINRGLSHQEMADLLGVSKRVVQKWCVEKHKLHSWSKRKYIKLNNKQKDIITGGILGDGHIDNREYQPMYIVSHAENQKDYLYWKYNILENLCNKPPTAIDEKYTPFGDKEYLTQKQYRLNTIILDELYELRSMSILDRIKSLNELSFSIFALDDGHRGTSNWTICVAKFSKEDKDKFIEICKDKFKLICHIGSDDRYMIFDAESSRDIDKIILRNIPNELDIIQDKIINNTICKPANYIYVIKDDERIGLSTYCRNSGYDYLNYRDYLRRCEIKEISEYDFRKIKVGV